MDVGGLQIDGLGDGVWMDFESDHSYVNQTAFGILQASRTRISKTNIFHVLLAEEHCLIFKKQLQRFENVLIT